MKRSWIPIRLIPEIDSQWESREWRNPGGMDIFCIWTADFLQQLWKRALQVIEEQFELVCRDTKTGKWQKYLEKTTWEGS